MYGIIFFDIDGTLRDEVLGVPESARQAVKALRDRGILVCICTGRTKATLPPDITDIPVDFLIAGGGSHVEGRGIMMEQSFFPSHAVDEIYQEFLPDTRSGVVLEGEHTLFMNAGAVRRLQADRREKEARMPYGEKQSIGITYLDNFKQFKTRRESISKLCLWAEEEKMESVRESEFWDYAQLAQAERLDSRTGYYEVIQKGCNKGEAAARLYGRLGIDKSRTMAFGDGMNDLDLFLAAGTSIAMESGKRELFPYADAVCEPPMEDGILKELKRRKII